MLFFITLKVTSFRVSFDVEYILLRRIPVFISFLTSFIAHYSYLKVSFLGLENLFRDISVFQTVQSPSPSPTCIRSKRG